MQKRKMNENKGIVRFTGGGALLTAMIGLIFLSPLAASGQDAEVIESTAAGGHCLGAAHAGPHRFGPGTGPGHHGMGHGMDIEFMTIVLDLSEEQAGKVEKLLEKHQDRMDDRIAENWKNGRREARKNRVHRHSRYDKVRSDGERAKIREERLQKREEMRKLHDSMRDDLDRELAGVLDDGQMKRLGELRALREARRDEMRAMRGERREMRGERGARRGRAY